MGSARHSIFMIANFILMLVLPPQLDTTDPGHELVMLWYWEQMQGFIMASGFHWGNMGLWV